MDKNIGQELEQLAFALKELGIPCREETLDQFQVYMEEILEWNEKVNLTSITQPQDFIKKHYID